MAARQIYLDHAATTPLDPAVLDAMLPFLREEFGNPSSVHRVGQTVRRAIDRARDSLAQAVGVESSEVYFTSGGTEADNTALIGVLLAARERGRDHLVTSTIEHHAVLDTARFLADDLGFAVTYVPADACGRVDPADVAAAVTERTALVSVQHANNEIGTIQPIRAIADAAHARGAFLHTDAVQTLGYLPVSADGLGADLITLSAHKIYGPKGAGALIVRRGAPWRAWQHGGMQEREKRAGTENAAAIVGFGRAVELLAGWRDAEAQRIGALRDRFVALVQARRPEAILNGAGADRLPHIANLAFPGASGETLLLTLDWNGIAASSGSACASGSIEPSHVLLALGQTVERAQSAVRFSPGRYTTLEELERTAALLAAVGV